MNKTPVDEAELEWERRPHVHGACIWGCYTGFAFVIALMVGTAIYLLAVK